MPQGLDTIEQAGRLVGGNDNPLRRNLKGIAFVA